MALLIPMENSRLHLTPAYTRSSGLPDSKAWKPTPDVSALVPGVP